MQEIGMTASFVNYPSTTSGVAITTEIEIIDPCLDPFSIALQSPQPPLPDYYYTGTNPSLEFTTIPFVVDPVICPVKYSCDILPGAPRTDLCSVIENGTLGSFDDKDGSFTFSSIDMANFPPDTYQMQVTGTSGLKTVSFVIDLVLVDPCLTVDLGI